MTAPARTPILSARGTHQLFTGSVLLKGAHALLELAGGVLFLAVSTKAIADLVNLLTFEELIEDPRDVVATRLLAWAQTLSVQTQHFYAVYLLSHGAVKLILVAGLLRGRLWSYPAALVAMTAFIVYQMYRYSYTHGAGLLLLTLFDLMVIALVWREYRMVRAMGGPAWR